MIFFLYLISIKLLVKLLLLLCVGIFNFVYFKHFVSVLLYFFFVIIYIYILRNSVKNKSNSIYKRYYSDRDRLEISCFIYII